MSKKTYLLNNSFIKKQIPCIEADTGFKFSYYSEALNYESAENIEDIKDHLFSLLLLNNENQKKCINDTLKYLFNISYELIEGQIYIFTNNKYEKISQKYRVLLSILYDFLILKQKKIIIYIDPINLFNFFKIKKYLTQFDVEYIISSHNINTLSKFDYDVTTFEPQIWVEGLFDVWSYNIIFNHKYKINCYGESSGIIELFLTNHDNSKDLAIIDGDGWSKFNKEYMLKFNIFSHPYSEIENFWIQPDILNAWMTDLNIEDKQTILIKNEENILNKANTNMDNVLNRYRNRQSWAYELELFPDNPKEIASKKIKMINDIKEKNINNILQWMDNKSLLKNTLSICGFKTIKQWQEKINHCKLNCLMNTINEKQIFYPLEINND